MDTKDSLKKIAHIMSDDKFIDKHINKFKESTFENHYYYLKEEKSYQGENDTILSHIVPYSSEFADLVKNVLPLFDIIVVYYLDRPKMDIVNAIGGKNTKIIWNFYGAELYNQPEIQERFLSEATKKLMKGGAFKQMTTLCKRFIKKNILNNYERFNKESSLFKAIKHIDYFATYSIEEYEFLNGIYENILPPFLLLSISNRLNYIVPSSKNETKILIGNSRSPWNNHIDIVEMFNDNAFEGLLTLPLSYGAFPDYVKNLKTTLDGNSVKPDFVEGFMTYPEYINFINSHSTAVFNTFRQMAIGNIFLALVCDVKVYLSNLNPFYKYLVNEGFIVYSVEDDLRNDIQTDNLKLDSQYKGINQTAYNKLSEIVKNHEFLNKIALITRI